MIIAFLNILLIFSFSFSRTAVGCSSLLYSYGKYGNAVLLLNAFLQAYKKQAPCGYLFWVEVRFLGCLFPAYCSHVFPDILSAMRTQPLPWLPNMLFNKSHLHQAHFSAFLEDAGHSVMMEIA
jgi:hypothetical protein